MLDSLFSTHNEDTFTLLNKVVALISALGLGFLITLHTFLFRRRRVYPQFYHYNWFISCCDLCRELLIGSNVAVHTAMQGHTAWFVFAVHRQSERYRLHLVCDGIGLACGMGYVPYAFVFAIIVILVIFLLHFTNFAKSTDVVMQQKITIPEDPILGIIRWSIEEIRQKLQLKRVRTTVSDLFEVVY